MKHLCKLRALAVALLMGMPFLASAVNFEWRMEPKYVGEIHAGYKTTTSLAGYNTYSAMAELGTLQGVSLNQYLDVTLGVDAFMLTHYYSGKGLRFGMNTYVNFRPAYPLSDDFKVFIDLGLGGFFNVHSNPELGNGFFCQFGPGFRFHKLNFSTGLQNFGSGSSAVAYYAKIGLYF